MLLAYLGPETQMLLPSILAGIAGVLMMFGRNVKLFFRGIVRRVWPFSRPSTESSASAQPRPTPSEQVPS
jgi:hypothetical protein